MEHHTWTDEEMRELLEDIGYDLNDDDGEFNESTLIEMAMLEGFKWNELKEVWKT